VCSWYLILITEHHKCTNKNDTCKYILKKNASFFNLFLKALYLQGIQNENNFCKVYIFWVKVKVKVWFGGEVDKGKVNGWIYSGRKTGAKLQTVVHLGEANGVFCE
jgi:hypothetical protein